VSLAAEVDEAVDFVHRYMAARGIADPREIASQVSSIAQQSMSVGSPQPSSISAASHEDTFDPYAHNTDFKGSSLIADDLEGNHRKGPRLNEALIRFKNMRRAGRHPRYITYAKLISAAAREGKMDLCHDILAMARTDMPMLPRYAVVRYGWSSILDAMVGASLTVGNRGRAEQYHQELLEMGAAPSANTFGLYITTLKESTKTFDEASEAVRIFQRAVAEGVEPSSFLYNALIGKLGKARRIDDCLFYFSEMRTLGIKPTSVTYGTVVNALCRVSDVKFAEELFDEMEGMRNYKARPAPYNSMMQFFLTTKRDKSKVLAYYERMKAKGITPTSHTYKLLVDTHATLEPVDMVAAESVVDTLRRSGERPEPVHYASLIHARGCVLHDMEGARRVFDDVVSNNIVPLNASIFQALFEAMVANHCVADTEELLNQMRSRRIEMTPYIANTLIHGWAAEKNIDKAQRVYDTLGRDKREPSTYEAMTRAYLAVELRDQAKGVVGEMLTRGYPSAVVNKVLELLGGGHEANAA
jgi:pentatricopeptide repeat protein